MEKVCHTGLSVFFMTSVLWQMVNLVKKEEREAVEPEAKSGRIRVGRGLRRPRLRLPDHGNCGLHRG